jgi:serine protease Do
MPSILKALVILLTLVLASTARADVEQASEKSVPDIAEATRRSIVVILSGGRDGQMRGLGTGFVVDPGGLIATNLHVIGEGRPIRVQFPDGRRFDAVAVHASDRKLDLAVIRIDAKDLTPIALAEDKSLKDGQSVVVLGHPRGLKYSIVSGVLSGRRDVEGINMLQLAIPIEPGNSGGPVLDRRGRVHGIVTMKSLITPNLGFATPVSDLKRLLARPNPIAMARWLTIGALDKHEWKTRFGGRWRQRAGQLIADGEGSGFGGRTLCLWQQPLPAIPFEAAVTLKLDDESGAAGLIFAADGHDKHYGFYPSGGKLRFVYFGGPNVYSWKIIKHFASPHYRPGGWNTFKVRIEKNKFLCYLNDHLEIEFQDNNLPSGAVGLAQFRGTGVRFKQFIVARSIPSNVIAGPQADRMDKAAALVQTKQAVSPTVIEALAHEGNAGVLFLRQKARTLEEQAARLRKAAQVVHVHKTLTELTGVIKNRKDIDLTHAALLIARLDNEDLDVAAYRKEMDRLARQVPVRKGAGENEALKALNEFLFKERGFHGSRFDYYTRANSYLNEVLDDREGIPITLSVLYMELARRLGANVEGVGMPGHFVVRHVPSKGKPQLIDVYDGGTVLSEEMAARIVEKTTGKPFKMEYLAATPKKAILIRMLHNLLNLARSDKDGDSMLRYLDAILSIDDLLAQERWLRAILRYQNGQRLEARADVDWLLKHHPPDLPLEPVRELKAELEGEGS